MTTRVRILTPAGSGAVAVVAISGPAAWAIARSLFRPAGPTPLPEIPPLHRVWFGNFGPGAGDEVLLAVKSITPEVVIEVHCHGGRRVVEWVVSHIRDAGATDDDSPGDPAWAMLEQAVTLRTAGILLDQCRGATGTREQLARYAAVGRHLIDPWKVVIAGPPNVGKSSLVNALAGFRRAVVSPTPGTTRDVIAVPLAFGGWPVELFDTAGLRRAGGDIEATGIERAKAAAAAADLVLWVLDATSANPAWPDPVPNNVMYVLNKCDAAAGSDDARISIRISAATGEGITELGEMIAARLVPDPPPAGTAVPIHAG